MRIVGGIYGGRRLNVPKNRDIRPTSDKVRGAVFNMLESRCAVDGARVLDGFCGSGALGLEALSRGATHCTFFDKARASLSLAKENAKMLGADEGCTFQMQDCLRVGERGNQDTYTLVFLDPPYGAGLVDRALSVLAQGGWFAGDAFIVCETEKAAEVEIETCFSLDAEKIYGDIKVKILRYRAGI